MSVNNRMLRSALWYAEKKKWYVFPIHAPIFNADRECYACTCEEWLRSEQCKQTKRHMYLEPGKHCVQAGKCPACRWAEKSTIDPEQIYKWWGHEWRVKLDDGWSTYYTPNIGIDCGKSNLLVFDADAYKDVYPDEDLLSIEDKQTITALTGGGGEHLIYNRQGKDYGNSTKGLPPGIDIRGDGGYIVAAPSLHKSGNRYQWEYGYGPHEIEPMPVPTALCAILDKATRRRINHEVGEANIEAVKRSARLVEQVLKRANIAHYGQQEYGQGRRWILENCPFNPSEDPHMDNGAAFVVVLEDGHIAASCHHNRCQHVIEDAERSGWDIMKSMTVTVESVSTSGARYPRVYTPVSKAA